jgi:hypothetical protein
MPRLFLSDVKIRPLVVSVDDSVGQGGVNRRSDVLLIQFLLKALSSAFSGKVGSWWKVPGSNLLKIDGQYGDSTHEYITLFQRQYTKFKLTQDGRVDPFVKGGWFGPRSHALMTMAALNMAYTEAEGDDAHFDMTDHPLFPREIRPALQISV